MKTIDDCKIIDLPIINDHRGNLSFIENSKHIPFSMERVYYLYDVPGGSHRGGHAHINLQQVLISLSGSFDVIVNDGANKKKFILDRCFKALYIPTMIWRELENFSSNSICLVLASTKYLEEDYIRDFNQFKYKRLNK